MSQTGVPRFSLVMPAYNAGTTIGRAIESILAQSYGGWELIIVDDGSTDETGSIAREYAGRDMRIRVVEQENAGCAAARRTGALVATGDFVTKMDADDALTPDALAVLSTAIDTEPGYDIYSATGYKVYPDGSRREIFGALRYLEPISLTVEDLIDECWIFSGAASIRRKTLERVGGFRADMRCEDYDLWLRALAQGATHRHIPAHIYLYSMGLPGRMNEDPRPSFRSYIEILEDLIARGLFTEEQTALARASIAKFEERIRQIDETGTTDAEFTDAQARRFKAGVTRLLGPRAGLRVLRAADRVKCVVRPVRLAMARRARLKGQHRE